MPLRRTGTLERPGQLVESGPIHGLRRVDQTLALWQSRDLVEILVGRLHKASGLAPQLNLSLLAQQGEHLIYEGLPALLRAHNDLRLPEGLAKISFKLDETPDEAGIARTDVGEESNTHLTLKTKA